VTSRARSTERPGGPPPHPPPRPISFLAPEAAATLHLVRENLRLLADLSRRHEVGRLDRPDPPDAPPDSPALAPAGRAFRSAREVAAYLGPELGDLAQEQLRALLLTTQYTLIACVLVAQGSVDGAPCCLADAFRAAVRAGAAAVIFAHNHPSGDPAPSPEDVRFTADAARAGALLGIEVLDHVVIGGGDGSGDGPGGPVRHASLRELGLYRPDDGDPAETEGAGGRAATADAERRAVLRRRLRLRRAAGRPVRPPGRHPGAVVSPPRRSSDVPRDRGAPAQRPQPGAGASTDGGLPAGRT
jgi:hypothetical protein